MSVEIQRHNPEGLWKGRAALYNHCVRVTNARTTLYLAGQLARDEQGQTVGVGDIRAQTAKVIENIRTILRAEGGDLRNLVKLTVFTTDMRYFDAIVEVRRRYFTDDLPASTIVEVNKLAQPDLLIEIEAVAAL
jgi:2-iminobutanoate/2-iminopropanoate deaminase